MPRRRSKLRGGNQEKQTTHLSEGVTNKTSEAQRPRRKSKSKRKSKEHSRQHCSKCKREIPAEMFSSSQLKKRARLRVCLACQQWGSHPFPYWIGICEATSYVLLPELARLVWSYLGRPVCSRRMLEYQRGGSELDHLCRLAQPDNKVTSYWEVESCVYATLEPSSQLAVLRAFLGNAYRVIIFIG